MDWIPCCKEGEADQEFPFHLICHDLALVQDLLEVTLRQFESDNLTVSQYGRTAVP